jgi:hypothetical protein
VPNLAREILPISSVLFVSSLQSNKAPYDMCFISLVRYRIKMNYAAACCASVDIGLKCPKSTTVRGREVFLS